MRLISLWGITLAWATWMASACAEEPVVPPRQPGAVMPRTAHQQANSTRKVLILGSSVSGGASSMEAQAAASLSFAVEVVTPTQWEAKTSQDFMSYRALIIGDAACTSGEAAFQAAINTKDRWGPLIDGNIIVMGSNPASNSTTTPPAVDPIVLGGVELAVSRPLLTGMYISLGCAYQSAPPGTQVPLLSPFGVFTVAGFSTAVGHAPNQVPSLFSQYVTASTFAGADGQAARTVFLSYPDHDFSVGALAVDETSSMPGAQSFHDYDEAATFTGAPFILIRGVTASGFGCGGDQDNVPAGEECDLGDNMNGFPATQDPPAPTCSWSCKTSWCGDGIEDPALGEECDLGVDNGRDLSGNIGPGSCSGMCRVLQGGQPPVALCQNVSVTVTTTCGAAANVDDGSYDPDGDLVGCTQSPAGPYGIGDTTVTLTCTDSEATSTSCTGTVSVLDGVVPTLTLTGPATLALQCGVDTYAEQGATANDLCSGDMTPSVTRAMTWNGAPASSVSNKPPGTYVMTYDVTDAAGNTPEAVTRTVTVSDTLKPTITLNGLANQNHECGMPYGDPGGSVIDACVSIAWGSVVKGGTVDNMVLGIYPLTYDVTDPSGNAADRKTRLVTVRDTRSPTLTVAPYTSVPVECGDPGFAHPPVTVSDWCDPGPFSPIPSRVVNTRLLGGQSATYSVTDRSGRVGVSGPRTFMVSDTLPPSLTLLGAAAMDLECGDPFADPGATASDQCAGDRTGSITRTDTVNNNDPGSYTVTYTVADFTGQTASATRTVTVSDSLAPSLALTGPASTTLECGTPFTDPGATANDQCEGDLSASIQTGGTVDHTLVATYTVHYTARDASGLMATSSRTINVVDTTPPALSIESQDIYYECTGYAVGNIWQAPAVTAVDSCQGPTRVQPFNTGDDDEDGLPGSIDPDDFGPGPDTQLEGQALVRYQAWDRSGNTQEASLSVHVWDTLKPVMGFNPDHDGGDPSYEQMECFLSRPPPFPPDPAPYFDPGVWAEDQCDGDLYMAVATFGEVDKQVPGIYTLLYQVHDGAFNWAEPLARTVEVIDSQQPAIIQNGPNTHVLECASGPYEDPGTTAFDRCDEQVHVEVNAAAVNPNVPGLYRVDYLATDSSGNMVSDSRDVRVDDTQAPTLRSLGGNLTAACGEPLPIDVVATDACEGDLSSQVQLVAPALTQPGTYPVRYQVRDSAGNTALSEPRTVTVPDPTQRVLAPRGSAELTLECNVDTYADFGAQAWDGCGTALPLSTYNSGQDAYGPGPDTSKEGTYYVEYFARNEKWHVLRALRAVNVVDRTPPVLTLQGPAHAPHPCGSAWEDPGVEALDSCYGDLRSSVVRTGEVNEQASGVYSLRYEVKDGAGLSAPPVERFVEIVGCPP